MYTKQYLKEIDISMTEENHCYQNALAAIVKGP